MKRSIILKHIKILVLMKIIVEIQPMMLEDFGAIQQMLELLRKIVMHYKKIHISLNQLFHQKVLKRYYLLQKRKMILLTPTQLDVQPPFQLSNLTTMIFQ